MKWRRGLLLAGIHVGILGFFMVLDEAGSWSLFVTGPASSQATLRLVAWQEEQAVPFNPCAHGIVDGPMTPPLRILAMGSLPVVLITGGHEACRSPSWIDSAVQARLLRGSQISEVLICAVLCALVAVQWLLVGGLPLIHPKRWWIEPGAAITALTCVTAVWLLLFSVLLHSWQLEELSSVPMYAAMLIWLVWFGLLIWKLGRMGRSGAVRMWALVRRGSSSGSVAK
jgi:hypothetical protein